MMFDHENGTMTDPRDGRHYKTISFEYGGKRYEWMAENLMYSVAPVTRTKGGRVDRSQPGVYSWAEAMRLNEGYMTRFVREGLIDSLHQGICPDGWHVANSIEWKTLLDYVDGNPNNLLDENWRTDRETAIAKGLTGVFYNRLEHNIALSSCATVEYIITEIQGKKHPEYITYDDLKIKSPFNTYLNRGLPPAPICNPGAVSLEAAFNPPETDYLYFLLKDPETGEHYFSKRFSEHNNARVLYLKKR